MPSPFDSSMFDAALGPMTEPVEWRQDKAPHRRGAFGAVLLHGDGISQSAGHTLGPVTADAWICRVSAYTSMAADIAVGDTIKALGPNAETLTVQQIIRDGSGFVFRCTAKQRAPR